VKGPRGMTILERLVGIPVAGMALAASLPASKTVRVSSATGNTEVLP
jgi:hypothetical protein